MLTLGWVSEPTLLLWTLWSAQGTDKACSLALDQIPNLEASLPRYRRLKPTDTAAALDAPPWSGATHIYLGGLQDPEPWRNFLDGIFGHVLSPSKQLGGLSHPYLLNVRYIVIIFH